MSKFSGQQKPKIVPDRRQPNGQPRRSKPEERAQILSVVLGQPHRRGSADDWRETPLGRLLRDGRVYHSSASPEQLWRAAEEYSTAFANIRRVWDSRRPLAVTGGGSRPDLSEEQKARYERAWGDMDRALRDAGVMAKKAVEYLLQDAPPHDNERVYAFWLIHGAGVGLAALAKMLEIVK